MPKFHVKETFEIPHRKLFVMMGSILEGEIHPGMFACIPFNPSVEMTVRVHSIETARHPDGEYVCLCIQSECDDMEFLTAFNIRDETLEVTIDGSD